MTHRYGPGRAGRIRLDRPPDDPPAPEAVRRIGAVRALPLIAALALVAWSVVLGLGDLVIDQIQALAR